MNLSDRFGRLTVISFFSQGSPIVKYCVCKCDCGNIKKIRQYSLSGGTTTSCGCFHKEVVSRTFKTHGDSKTRLYSIYAGIKKRVFYEGDKEYHNYGGRGITICKKWMKFEPFKEWALSHGYNDSLTIERKNYNGNYNSRNCKWIPMKDQALNRRDLVMYKGESRTQAGLRLGGSAKLIRDRITKLGWSKKRAYETPVITKSS